MSPSIRLFSHQSTSYWSEMMLYFRGCVLGLVIAVAGVSGTDAFAQTGNDATADATVKAAAKAAAKAEVSTDEELSLDAAGDLSVDPTGDIIYPAGRPQWLDQSPTPDDKPTVWPIKSLPSSSPEKARESLEVQVQGAMAAYAELALNRILGDEATADGAADRLIGNPLLQVDLDSGVVDRFSGTVEIGGVTHYEEAARLTFDEKFDRRLERAWKAEEVEKRLGRLGVVGGVGVCLLMAGTGLVRRIAGKHNHT